jgi:preprotein translocase subunit SecA
VSLEDEIYVMFAQRLLGIVRRWVGAYGGAPGSIYAALRRLAQSRAERRGVQIRMQNLRQDRRLDWVLAFSGRGE